MNIWYRIMMHQTIYPTVGRVEGSFFLSAWHILSVSNVSDDASKIFSSTFYFTMKKVIYSLFFAFLFGAAAAFFRPAIPYQVEVDISKPVSFPLQSVDLALDNPDIAEDQNISPARKCGFCMGWAGQTAWWVSFVAPYLFFLQSISPSVFIASFFQ